MGYKVILDDKFIKFNKRVETAQQEGWQCQGGVSVSIDSNNETYFAQAMVREDYDFPEFIEAPQEPRPVYKVGDRVRVIANTTHHHFDIGAEVIVEGVYEHPKPYITATYQDRCRNLYFDDIEPLSKAPKFESDELDLMRSESNNRWRSVKPHNLTLALDKG